MSTVRRTDFASERHEGTLRGRIQGMDRGRERRPRRRERPDEAQNGIKSHPIGDIHRKYSRQHGIAPRTDVPARNEPQFVGSDDTAKTAGTFRASVREEDSGRHPLAGSEAKHAEGTCCGQTTPVRKNAPRLFPDGCREAGDNGTGPSI